MGQGRWSSSEARSEMKQRTMIMKQIIIFWVETYKSLSSWPVCEGRLTSSRVSSPTSNPVCEEIPACAHRYKNKSKWPYTNLQTETSSRNGNGMQWRTGENEKYWNNSAGNRRHTGFHTQTPLVGFFWLNKNTLKNGMHFFSSFMRFFNAVFVVFLLQNNVYRFTTLVSCLCPAGAWFRRLFRWNRPQHNSRHSAALRAGKIPGCHLAQYVSGFIWRWRGACYAGSACLQMFGHIRRTQTHSITASLMLLIEHMCFLLCIYTLGIEEISFCLLYYWLSARLRAMKRSRKYLKVIQLYKWGWLGDYREKP